MKSRPPRSYCRRIGLVLLGRLLLRALEPRRTTEVYLGTGEWCRYYGPIDRASREMTRAARAGQFVPVGMRGKVVWMNPRMLVLMIESP
jgi:hypothetical protein